MNPKTFSFFFFFFAESLFVYSIQKPQ
uniref:Uncharacterized protein n=1 Tax=Rhizophora mucronata TaxID=61149 RepID=A0A2P2JHQ7_RHIMU